MGSSSTSWSRKAIFAVGADRIEPSSNGIIPAMALRSVVFPHPFGPVTRILSPLQMLLQKPENKTFTSICLAGMVQFDCNRRSQGRFGKFEALDAFWLRMGKKIGLDFFKTRFHRIQLVLQRFLMLLSSFIVGHDVAVLRRSRLSFWKT